ncbi:hypothetical protein [Variovorax sp. J31P207]|uniref:hypothetical protein n=1 Tax=Variovorax sp. J31P207 TaxID=3053510 RepID=UPI00257636DB|nr:hypothetical protein [Variovorax sp. J31P207]MDM0071625.1 hypothetical protein [Variovorax sp. J31P207]
MRTTILLAAAALLLASLHGVVRLLHLSSALASVVFLFLWLAASTFNMWFGMVEAGYTLAQEWPVFMVLFGLPAICALLLQWRLASST